MVQSSALGEGSQTAMHQEFSFALTKNILYKQMHRSLHIEFHLDLVWFLIINPCFLAAFNDVLCKLLGHPLPG